MSAVILGLIVLIFVAVVHYYIRYYRIVKYYGNLRGPFPVPFLGNVLQFNTLEGALPCFYNYMKKYGKVHICFSGYRPYITVNDSELCNKLMTSPDMNAKDYIYTFFHGWLGTGLLTSTGRKWLTHRKLITPTFHYKILKSFAVTFETMGDILIQKLSEVEEGKSFDVVPFINLYTMDVICESALGTKINAQLDCNNKYVYAVRHLLNLIIRRIFDPWKQLEFMYMFFPSYREQAKLTKIIHDHTDGIIASRKKLHNQGRIDLEMVNEYGSKMKVAFIDMLISGSIDGVPLTDEEIREEVNTFMFEGHDTTTSALAFILYSISIHTEVQNKLHEETLGIFGDDTDRHATFEELQEMPYLETVIKESLRLYPPIPVYSRFVSEDLDFGTLKIRANTSVSMAPYIMHRVPEYFPEPEKFIPERFSAENVHKIKPFSYIPFSGGFRNCIGQKFAMLEMKSAVSRIVRNFEIRPDPTFELAITLEILMKTTNGIRIRLKKRK